MSIEQKLDEILWRLTRIEERLDIVDTAIPSENPVKKRSKVKPSKEMLVFQSAVELGNRMDRNAFFRIIRRDAHELMEVRKSNPNFRLSFRPQLIARIEERIQKTHSQFYVDLKIQSEAYAKAVEMEGLRILDRAIAKLSLRA